jgi:hypothetical protein
MSSEKFVWHRPTGLGPGPKTHALVIGTRYYDYLPLKGRPGDRLGLRQLDCAAGAGAGDGEAGRMRRRFVLLNTGSMERCSTDITREMERQ